MNGPELFVDEIDNRLYAAIVHKGRVADIYLDPPNMTGSWASIYLGRVTKIDSKLDAAIVDLGDGLTGYLPAKHVRLPGSTEAEARTGISELLKGGQMVLVQVKSEGRAHSSHENQKLPRLTMKLYIPGLFLVYSPNSNQVTISRRIENNKTLALTAKLKGKGGWIGQHHAEKAAAADIEFESGYLQESWQSIANAAEARKGQPGLLKAGPNALYRALVDHSAASFEHIYVGNKQLLDLATGWCERHLPALAASKRLRLFKPEKPGQRLFDIPDIYSAMEALKENVVHLSSGGTIIIEHTSAITVIDVNQGSAESISEVNIAAAIEIARQARMRTLSGAILIDFINMDQKMERVRLLEAVELAFADDTANAQVHGFTRLGMIELTRKRRSATLAEKLKKQAV